MGLCSDGGIHSFLPHLFGLQRMAKKCKISEIYIHAFLDGRDVGERTAKGYLQQIEDQKIGTIATIGGRFYGMDRDTNWDRIQPHYDILCDPNQEVEAPKLGASTWKQIIDNFYQSTDKSDYYIPPVLLEKEGQIKSNDVVIFFNYRTDRARQISSTLADDKFDQFPRPVKIDSQNFGTFGPYYEDAQRPFAFGKSEINNTIGEVVSNLGQKQLRISETEKFNHVTFFFSGERKEEFPGEKRILIPSPKCTSYAEKPEMAARIQTDAAIAAIENDEFALVVQNFANADLVGHSGDLNAAIQAIEVLDKCLSKLIPVVLKKEYDIILTADHGNADEMIYPNGEESAAHSKNLVPCFVILNDMHNIQLYEKGTLADIAPTICELLEVEKTREMTGMSLIKISS